jgi:apolipoprotein D and lipocalin family protein
MANTAASVITRLAGIGAAMVAIALSVATAAPPLKTVEHLDAERWAGTWFEVARVPNSLQARCRTDATTTYLPQPDGSLRVVQRCRDADDNWFVATARAVGFGGELSASRFKLSYLPAWLDWLPAVRGDHWVVMLDDDYRYAVISEPSREQLWILSRTPELEASTYDAIVARLRNARFPVDELVPTPQLAQRLPPAQASRPRLMV